MIKLLYIDLFCGAGGTSTGVENARYNEEQCAKVIACVNHDANAIASHAANHPDALHFTEDIRTLELSPLVAHVERMKKIYPDTLIVLWASLECTNFSKAKGGQPRDADSRTLAEHLFRYIEAIDPDYIQIENVEEFMSWGDMDEKGHPISKDKGRCYEKWKRNVKRYGYDFDWRILNAADYGAYTTRKRFFGIFARHGFPIVFPEPTHCKDGRTDMFGRLEKWRPVKEVLDFSDEGESIFSRKKPLAEKTLERIYAGLIKFVAGGKEAFIVKYNSMSRTGKYQAPSIDEPCPVVATQGRLALAKVNFLSKQFSGQPNCKNISVDGPAGTITCKDHHAFVSAYYGNGHNHSVEQPAPTVTTKDRLALVNPSFLCSYNFKDKGKDINLPCPTLLTKDRLSLVTPFFMNYYSGGGQLGSIETPCPAIMTVPKQNLVTPVLMKQFPYRKPWIMNTAFSNVGSSIEQPSQTITANRKWHYLMNPQFASAGGSVNNPCFTLIARMDKMPPYLVEAEGGFGIQITPEDSLMTIKIKEFMVLYGIIDIKMRMLRIPELKRIMGFPDDYILIGPQSDQKKFIGNAVEVNMARVLCEAICREIIRKQKVA